MREAVVVAAQEFAAGPEPGAKNSGSSYHLPPLFFDLFYLHQFTFRLSQTWLTRVKPTGEPVE
jgi:hypothetical protein